uniref:Uncharacterized protein n=1 Tax=Lepeophtheirus salmonis TaxID=72036 RepID=A0A0K2U532_LEPSM
MEDHYSINVCKAFRGHLEFVIAADGGYIQ